MNEHERPVADLAESLDALGRIFNHTAVQKGFYGQPSEDGTRLMLIVSELAEALEAYRHGNPPSEKIPTFDSVEEELADAIIRILDHCAHKGYRIGRAVAAKHAYNLGRDHMHGGKRF